jgi:hypothetical protein
MSYVIAAAAFGDLVADEWPNKWSVWRIGLMSTDIGPQSSLMGCFLSRFVRR